MPRDHKAFPRQIVRTICLFCALLIAGQSIGFAQHKANRLRPRYLSNSAPDPERGREILANFRNLGLAGDYFLEFDLEVLPRRGKRTVVPGRMWGSRNEEGAVFRAEVNPSDPLKEERLLAQNGPGPQAWRFTENERVSELDVTALLDPIGDTGLITMFELQMPFIYWPDHIYEGTTEVRGRAVHAFLMYPPESFAAAHPDIAGVRLHLDANFHALMQAVILDETESPRRKLTVLDLKKLGDQWIVKSIDVRDETTRDKVRFKVTAAALDLEFSPQLFSPEFLPVRVDPPVAVQSLGW